MHSNIHTYNSTPATAYWILLKIQIHSHPIGFRFSRLYINFKEMSVSSIGKSTSGAENAFKSIVFARVKQSA